ncbi:hypothetical protein BGZ95_005453 [Linnemannia exigua]|uniref:Uncharacterized protein n=1 Tax=Linnemannia exigua TaxID=604196 RepID=A0AAD4DIH0_9FUNG|nr:hypothetical protein BGZ95_005453 [Linnemannia exigua]
MSKESSPTPPGPPQSTRSTTTHRTTSSQSSTSTISTFSSIGTAAKIAVKPSSTSTNRSVSHGLAAILVEGHLVPSGERQEHGTEHDNDDIFTSSQRIRKRDRFLNLFRSSSPEPKVESRTAEHDATTYLPSSIGIKSGIEIGHVDTTFAVHWPASWSRRCCRPANKPLENHAFQHH